MNIFLTGGAGFIGRWVVKQLLENPTNQVTVLDNFSNSRLENLAEFTSNEKLRIIQGDITDGHLLDSIWQESGPFDIVFHLAAQIRVQDSIDDPLATFQSDVVGTMDILERCRRQYFQANGISLKDPFHLTEVESRLVDLRPRVVFMSTCMVYAPAPDQGLDEHHPTRPVSPYGAAKIAAENLVLSYHHAYKLPTKVIRPFNTYGPYQKRNSEGGVVAIFIARDLAGKPLHIKGDGTQTRDLLYVEDCARFVVQAGLSCEADGEILNAGLGSDVSINELASQVSDPAHGGYGVKIEHIPHDHPQAEITKLLCNHEKATRLLGWKPKVNLREGIARTRAWIVLHPGDF